MTGITYTLRMDRVRLGRVLGRGARMAARTAYEAMDAATAPEPRVTLAPQGSAPAAARSPAPPPGPSPAHASQHGADRVSVLRPVAARAVTAGRQPGMFAPVRRASRAVSLEVTGSFFALFALSFSLGMWHARAEVHAGSHGVARFAAYGAVSLFFAYCAVSSFVRAKQLK